MRVVGRVVLALVLAASLLVAGAGAGAAVASDDPTARDGRVAASSLTQQGDESVVNVTQEFSLTPSTPGEVRVQVRYAIPARVLSLETEVPAEAEVTESDGFRPASGETYEWDATTSNPSLTYTYPVNESLNDTSPEGAEGDLVAVDAGDWALFERPAAPTEWRNYAAAEPVEFERTATTDGPGATGEWLVFLGEHETYERTAADQRFTLVVPANAETTDSPRRVLASLADASDALRVGNRDEDVFVVAAPTDGVQWGVRGLQTGEADLWVRDVEPVASPDNAWVHEYVHSRQEFSLDPEMAWFREASASYYAALLTFEQGQTRFDGFSERMGAGANDSDAVLANQSTWTANPDYDRGALVAGQLDRRIRTERNGERTLQAVFTAMNEAPDELSLSDFLALLAEHGDRDVADAGERYAGTTADVEMWNRSAHVAAFGDLPARIGFQLPTGENDGSYAIDGSYRNVTLDGDADPVVLVADERLRVGAVVDNAGGRTGNYTATLAVNRTVVDSATGSLGPNESETTELGHRFATPGTYELALGGDNRTVVVSEPADARVTDVTASARDASVGESVDVSARVENDADLPGAATVVFRRDDGFSLEETVRLGPGATERVTVSMPLSTAGNTTVGVDGAGSVTVAVDEATGQARTHETETGTPAGATGDRSNGSVDRTDVPFAGSRWVGAGGITLALAVVLGLTLALRRSAE